MVTLQPMVEVCPTRVELLMIPISRGHPPSLLIGQEVVSAHPLQTEGEKQSY